MLGGIEMFLRQAMIGFGVFAVMSGAAWAGELAPRYSQMGQMQVEMGDEVLDLVIAYDKEKQRGYATQKMIMGSHLTINSAARAVDDSGQFISPMVQVTLQQQSGKFKMLSAELYDEQGYDAPMAMGADGGKGAVTELTFENNRLDAVVEGEFIRLVGYMKGDAKPADGVAPVPVTIRWSVELAPLK
ncbi:hypothetical protein RXV86_15890 [Alisedimentitalea sp. MJ-SS2]|uniref:hypothetical protein n=1 Tax=Aliisedimentitalea sp. MJ-SS2 TaxID=3049795 RepID=UPI0029092F4B|nr:hypothetical protein [Alisedimentitalea sp. MJ-SS2]MDU8928874.1 hypothetical protein [Alisedimentitalea sp. MJ-SS2]